MTITIYFSMRYFGAGSYAISASSDGTWSFLDVARNSTLCTVSSPSLSSSGISSNGNGYLSAQFHPDGIMIGCGTHSGIVRIWDVREQANVGNCDSGASDTELGVSSRAGANGVSSLSFSENGYILAAGYENGYARLWDLRKLKCSKRYEGGTYPPMVFMFLLIY